MAFPTERYCVLEPDRRSFGLIESLHSVNFSIYCWFVTLLASFFQVCVSIFWLAVGVLAVHRTRAECFLNGAADTIDA